MRKPNQELHFDFAVVGTWHLAYVTAASLLKLGHRVALVNTEASVTNDPLESPVFEPGLTEILTGAKRSGQYRFIESLNSEWSADVLWLAVDTPLNERDEVDVTPLRKVVAALKDSEKSSTNTLILSSQVPLGFSESLQKDFGFEVAYIPENLRLGHGIETFLNADRTVIGAGDPDLAKRIQGLLTGVQTDFLLCDLSTAEMIKHATNAFLATSISFSNELARIGELYGVDNQLVGTALRMDKRIGKKAYVVPGLGFAGGTLSRDLRVLQSLGSQAHVPTPLMDAVVKVNESTTEAIFNFISNYFDKKLNNKTILILGYTYKAETNTLRRSLSVTLAEFFKKQGARVWGFDPFMNNADLSAFGSNLAHFSSWNEIPSCPDAALVMTARADFASLDWLALKKKGTLEEPLIVDVRGVLSPNEALKSRFVYKSLWQPVLKPREGGAPLA